jgi:hypothetical protein
MRYTRWGAHVKSNSIGIACAVTI